MSSSWRTGLGRRAGRGPCTHAGPHVGPVGGETMHKTPPSMVFCALTAAPCRSSCSATSTCPLEEALINTNISSEGDRGVCDEIFD